MRKIIKMTTIFNKGLYDSRIDKKKKKCYTFCFLVVTGYPNRDSVARNKSLIVSPRLFLKDFSCGAIFFPLSHSLERLLFFNWKQRVAEGRRFVEDEDVIPPTSSILLLFLPAKTLI